MAELAAAARGHQIIVSDRHTPGEPALFDSAPDLVAFVRVAVDIRNVDCAAASRNGMLVTHASPGFMASVAEWIIGAMIDCGRDITRLRRASTAPAARTRTARMGRQLEGARSASSAMARSAATSPSSALALGMRVLVDDPYATGTTPG